MLILTGLPVKSYGRCVNRVTPKIKREFCPPAVGFLGFHWSTSWHGHSPAQAPLFFGILREKATHGWLQFFFSQIEVGLEAEERVCGA